MRNIRAAHWACLHEAKTSVDDTCQDDNAAKPLVEGAQRASTTGSVVIQMLVNAERGLKDDQTGNDDVPKDLVVTMEQI